MVELKRKIAKKQGWTPARRAAQSARMKAAKIWLASTGPRTAAGKARVSQNALKAGAHSAGRRFIHQALNAQARYVRTVFALKDW